MEKTEEAVGKKRNGAIAIDCWGEKLMYVEREASRVDSLLKHLLW